MILQFTKKELTQKIGIVQKAVPAKSPMPIMECILIDATHGKINFVGNDTEFGIETDCAGNILEAGKVALDARLFSDIARNISGDDNDEIIVEVNEKHVATICCGEASFDIAGLNGEEFTLPPRIDRNQAIVLSEFSLKNMITETIFSIALNDNNKKMTGEFLEVDQDLFRITALDGHRISIRKLRLKDSYEYRKAIVPGKALQELTKILSGGMEDEISIYFSQNHIMFELESTTVITRLIDGDYFHVQQMLSEDYETKFRVNRKALLKAVNSSTILSRDNEKQPLIFTINDDFMNLQIRSNIGKMTDKVPIEKNGKDLMIGFNPKYIMDALNAIDEEEVTIYMTIPRSPCFIRDDEESYNYMILPVNFNPDAV